MGRFLCDFYSYSLGREVSVTILLPTISPEEGSRSHRLAAAFPVLYFIHGSGNDGSTAARYSSMERYVQQDRIAIVLFSHEDKSGRTLPARIPEHPSGTVERLEPFEAFIQQELPEFLTSYFPLSSRREDTYIAGLSQGGYIALSQALLRPERYRAAGCFSGMFFTRTHLARLAKLSPEEVRHMPAREVPKHLLPEFAQLLDRQDPSELPHLFFSRGDQEASIGVCSDAMAALLASKGAQIYLAEDKPFGHEWDNWDMSLREFLSWIPRTDSYQRFRRRQRGGMINGTIYREFPVQIPQTLCNHRAGAPNPCISCFDA